MEDRLSSIYYDPSHPASFGSVAKLLAAVPGASKKDILSWLKGQDAYTLHKPKRKHFKRNRIIVFAKDQLWEADIMDCSNISKFNAGYKYILVVIDVLSKYGYVKLLKSKGAIAVCRAFTGILKLNKPTNLRTDKGKEFLNSCFKDLTTKHGINHYTTINETKAAVVERWIRTLRMKMAKYFTANNSRRYIDVLGKLIESYNNTKHRSIGMKPKNVTIHNQKQARDKLYEKMKPPTKKFKFKVGQYVRISKLKNVFEKEYVKNWSDEIFVIKQKVSREIPVYKIVDLNGERISGTFYEFEMSLANKPVYYKIDKIIKRRGNRYYVKFKHYGKSFNQWIDGSDMIDI